MLLLSSLSNAFSISSAGRPSARSSPMMAEMANGKMLFDNVAREWRCKWQDDGGGKASSATLVAIADVVDEFLPQLKALDGAVVNRAVCGGCLDFKLCTTVPLATFGPWEEAGHPPEADFLAKLEAIPGVSMVETQTMTNQVL
mmetsp:Transcript_122/g.354  ORF Transcript_122/g.354 Transcript_122/m.354 type:complete len:143 (+) Transcript_122:103-531(+)